MSLSKLKAELGIPDYSILPDATGTGIATDTGIKLQSKRFNKLYPKGWRGKSPWIIQRIMMYRDVRSTFDAGIIEAKRILDLTDRRKMIEEVVQQANAAVDRFDREMFQTKGRYSGMPAPAQKKWLKYGIKTPKFSVEV